MKENRVDLERLLGSKSEPNKDEKNRKKSTNNKFIFHKSYNALELYNLDTINIPKLVDPFLQKSGLATLVGTSDTGKSTFLRQLSLAIVLKSKTFLDFDLKCEHNKVLYVTTEDDYTSVSFSIRKQLKHLKESIDDFNLANLKNLEFIFETEDLLNTLKTKIEKEPVDLIIIDAFTDVFDKEINANTQVRSFLNRYSNLAHENNCLILFLHHIGKRTQNQAPSKDSIIGSQAYEAKMRVVLELRPNQHSKNSIELWVLKSNFLQTSYKQKSYVLDLNEHLVFKNTGLRTNKYSDSKSSNPELIKKILDLNQSGLSVRKIEEKLQGTDFELGKSTINTIIKNNKKK